MSDTILVLSDLDQVRERPGMFIGDNDRLGMNTIVREVIDNAVDEYANYADKTLPIEVTIDAGDVITVRDYGRGISPYESKANPGEIEERLAYTRVGSGGKFRANREQNGNQFSGGLNGTGAAAANAMSNYFDVTIYKDERVYHDRFEDGIPVVELENTQLPYVPQTGTITTGTSISFQASKRYMRVVKVDVAYLQQYLQQVAYLNPGLKIVFSNNRDNDECITYYSENGLLDYMSMLAVDENGSPLSYLIEPFVVDGFAEAEVLNHTNHMYANIAVAFVKGDTFAAETFTNGIENTAGGTHLQGFYQGLIDIIRHYYAEFQSEISSKYRTQLELIRSVNNLSNISEVAKLIKAHHVSRRTYVIIDFKHDDPILKPQTKDKLASPEAKGAVSKIFYDKALLHFDRNISAVQELIGHLIKELYEKAKDENTNVKLDKNEIKQILSTKLSQAKGKKADENELFLVEGDSAAGPLKSNRDANYQAVLPLRGKVLNAAKATLAKILANTEIATFIYALGTGIGSKYDESKLKYSKIIIATDQDVDGLHIRVLLITFMLRYMPDLIKNGHVYYLDTPLYVNVMKGNAEDVYTYGEEEQVEFLKTNASQVDEVQRNKGLGELSKKEVIRTILEPKTRVLSQLVVEDEDALYDLVERLMGKDVQGRKRLFIEESI